MHRSAKLLKSAVRVIMKVVKLRLRFRLQSQGIIYGRKSKGLDILRDELQKFHSSEAKSVHHPSS